MKEECHCQSSYAENRGHGRQIDVPLQIQNSKRQYSVKGGLALTDDPWIQHPSGFVDQNSRKQQSRASDEKPIANRRCLFALRPKCQEQDRRQQTDGFMKLESG
jgi:hypothetical protein